MAVAYLEQVPHGVVEGVGEQQQVARGGPGRPRHERRAHVQRELRAHLRRDVQALAQLVDQLWGTASVIAQVCNFFSIFGNEVSTTPKYLKWY